jgi:hypothetical protein
VVLSGNQALDPAGLAPAIVTGNRTKVTVALEKNLRIAVSPVTNLNAARAASTLLFAFLPGQIDQIPLSIKA